PSGSIGIPSNNIHSTNALQGFPSTSMQLPPVLHPTKSARHSLDLPRLPTWASQKSMLIGLTPPERAHLPPGPLLTHWSRRPPSRSRSLQVPFHHSLRRPIPTMRQPTASGPRLRLSAQPTASTGVQL